LGLEHVSPEILHLLVEGLVGRRVELGALEKSGCSSKRSTAFCCSVSAAFRFAGMPQ
jgi:hypothetical protein